MTSSVLQTYDFRQPVAPKHPQTARDPLQHSLPRSTGDNKLTERMVPGYTGQSTGDNKLTERKVPGYTGQSTGYGKLTKGMLPDCTSYAFTPQTRYGHVREIVALYYLWPGFYLM